MNIAFLPRQTAGNKAKEAPVPLQNWIDGIPGPRGQAVQKVYRDHIGLFIRSYPHTNGGWVTYAKVLQDAYAMADAQYQAYASLDHPAPFAWESLAVVIFTHRVENLIRYGNPADAACTPYFRFHAEQVRDYPALSEDAIWRGAVRQKILADWQGKYRLTLTEAESDARAAISGRCSSSSLLAAALVTALHYAGSLENPVDWL
jgi:hypothetical protein